MKEVNFLIRGNSRESWEEFDDVLGLVSKFYETEAINKIVRDLCFPNKLDHA